MADMFECFNAKLSNLMKSKKPNCGFMTKARYDDLLKKVNASKSKTSGKKPEDYQRLKRYDVIKVGDIEKLIFPRTKDSPSAKFYAHFEELFTILHETHLAIGHGGRNKMVKELKKKYKNITTEVVMIYLNLCENCQKKTKVPNKGQARPVVFQEMLNSRCQVDIIDMESQPDSDFKFILVYQDCLTKFIRLRALKAKDAREIANNLIDIFTILGAPSVLQSDNGRDFSSEVVKEACSIWPDLKIVHGKPTETAERPTKDVENKLRNWLENHPSSKWSEGLCFVQLLKNRTFHEDLRCTPYEAMFGTPMKVGLKTSSFPNTSVEHLTSEEELQALIETVQTAATIKTEKNDSDVDTDPLHEGQIIKVEPPSEDETEIDVKVEPRSEDEDLLPQHVIVSPQRHSRKRSNKGVGSRTKKMSKVSSSRFSHDDAEDLQDQDFDRTGDPGNLLEVILEVKS